MVDSLCKNYGQYISTIDGVKWYSFPKIRRISEIPELELRNLKFGYRANFIPKAAQQIVNNGDNWLTSLRALPGEEAHAKLTTLMGIGPKVANCISLFSLDKYDTIPVDTHVWQIAQKFMPSLKGKKQIPLILRK